MTFKYNALGGSLFAGWPPARVVWLQDGQVVDANYEVNKKEGVSFNALEVGATRGDLQSPFVCQASNNDVTTPLTTTYTRNVTCKTCKISSLGI